MLDENLPLERVPYAVVDTETTGVDDGSRVLEVALYRFEGGILQGAVTTLINPEVPIPPDATKAHGITDEMVRTAPTFREVAGALARFLANAVIAGHNIDFDRRMLEVEYRRLELEEGGAVFETPVPVQRACTLALGRLLFPDGKHTLSALAERLELPAFEAHRAAADAKISYVLLHRLLKHWRVQFPDRQPTVGYLTKLDVWPHGKPAWLLRKEREAQSA